MRISLSKHKSLLPAVLAILLVTSCTEENSLVVSDGRREHVQAFDEPWLTIEENPEALEGLKKKVFSRDQQRLNELLRGEIRFLEPYHERIFRDQREAIRAHVAAKLQSAKNSEQWAMITLGLKLRMDEIRPLIVDALGSSDNGIRKKALRELSSAKPWEDEDASEFLAFIAKEKKLERAVVNCLDHSDPTVVSQAVETSGTLSLRSSIVKFGELLGADDLAKPGRLIFWIGKLGAPHQYHEAILEAFEKADADQQDWAVSTLSEVLNSQDPALRSRARSLLKKFVETGIRDSRGRYTTGSTQSALGPLCETATKGDLDWIRSLANLREPKKQSVDEIAAITRISPTEGEAIIRTLLTKRGTSAEALSAIKRVGTESVNSSFASHIADAHFRYDHEWEEAFNLIRMFGTEEMAEQHEKLLSHIDEKSLKQRLQSASTADPENIEILDPETRQRVIELGLLTPNEIEKGLSNYRTFLREEEQALANSISIRNLLAFSGREVAFDVETGMFPNQHDELLFLFAESSQGKFQPQASFESVFGDYENARYQLEFIANDKLYRGELVNYGDWYDVERTVAMINQALGDAGHEERFWGLVTGDQSASYIFGKFEILRKLASVGELEFARDPNASRKNGQEFERRVLESYKREN